MRRKFNVRQRNYIILGLCSILLVMAAGYAAFRTQLTINGTSNITSDWKVLITDIQSNVLSGDATDAEEPSHTETTATFKTNLVSPGDSMQYDITVENRGDIDAVLESIDVKTSENEAILFETSGIKRGDKLLPEESDVLTVVVTYNPEVTDQPDNLNSEVTVTLNYVQDDGSILPEPDPVDITDNVVTSGDGLYEDEYEEGRYVYKGSNPNNYIALGESTDEYRLIYQGEDAGISFSNKDECENLLVEIEAPSGASCTLIHRYTGGLWRIIAKETDGTYKILRNEMVTSMSFDSIGARTTGYCSQGNAPTDGCSVWSSTANMVGSPAEFVTGSYTGSVDADSEMLTYLNGEYYNSLERTIKEEIVNHNFNVGGVDRHNNYDLEAVMENENRYKWNGNIGLISVSDYIRANSNIERCESIANDGSICMDTNWMNKIETSIGWSTLSAFVPYDDSSFRVWYINYSGFLADGYAVYREGVRPVVYLTSNLSLSGSGTESDPYIIVS